MTNIKTNTIKNTKNSNNKGEIKMTIQEKFNNTTLRADYSKAINAVLILKQELNAKKGAYETAQDNKADYRQQVAKAKKGANKVELFAALSKDPENLRLLKIVNDCANAVKTAETAVDLALENLGRAVHNIMMFEAKENIDKLAKYKIGYKRFAACFTIGRMSPYGNYDFEGCTLPYTLQNRYFDFERYTFNDQLQINWIKEYKPYQILTTEEIKEELAKAQEFNKYIDEQLNALRAKIEAENEKRKFYDLTIKSPHVLSLSFLNNR